MSEIRDVIIACDFSSSGETFSFLEKFGNARPYLKIGMELFYAEGPQIVRALKDRGHKLFLDLKLHDIPNTVRRSMHVLSSLQVDMVNLHAAGTRAMMEAAMEGITRPDGSRPLLIAVTQLTSTDQARLKEELLIEAPLEDVVVSYAQNAASAGLDGVVCSPLEADSVHQHCGSDFLAVTPGIRFRTVAQMIKSVSLPRLRQRYSEVISSLSGVPSLSRMIRSPPGSVAARISYEFPSTVIQYSRA